MLKMHRKGVSPHVIRWMQAWLSNRQSLETFEGATSKKTILKQDVPQGSVLSPLLFLFIDELRSGSGDLPPGFQLRLKRNLRHYGLVYRERTNVVQEIVSHHYDSAKETIGWASKEPFIAHEDLRQRRRESESQV